MSWSRPARVPSAVALRLASLVLAAAAAALPAAAETVYKWTDAEGKAHYGDKPPKGFTGEVSRIEIDPAANATAAPKPPPATAPAAAPATASPAPDILQQRRATRTKLEGNLAAARERLDLARKALAEASSPQDDERQVIQQQMGDNAKSAGFPAAHMGGGLGMTANRSNCRQVASAGGKGKATTVCTTTIGNEKYDQRVAALEDAVKRAEVDVEEAERAYRRGVD